MWVFDGEDWVEEGVSEKNTSSSTGDRPAYDMFFPEPQLIEIPAIRPEHSIIPPFPMP